MKKYIAPTSNVVMLRTATQILINSTEYLRGEASSETVGMSREQRSSSSWDDEDEQSIPVGTFL